MRGRRGFAVAALVSVVSVAGTGVATAAWSKTGSGTGSAAGSTFAISFDSVVQTKCQGANHTLTLSWTGGPQTPDAATVNVLHSTTAGAEGSTVYGTATVGSGKFVDNGAAAHNFYKIQVVAGSNWKSALSGELSSDC